MDQPNDVWISLMTYVLVLRCTDQLNSMYMDLLNDVWIILGWSIHHNGLVDTSFGWSLHHQYGAIRLKRDQIWSRWPLHGWLTWHVSPIKWSWADLIHCSPLRQYSVSWFWAALSRLHWPWDSCVGNGHFEVHPTDLDLVTSPYLFLSKAS